MSATRGRALLKKIGWLGGIALPCIGLGLLGYELFLSRQPLNVQRPPAPVILSTGKPAPTPSKPVPPPTMAKAADTPAANAPVLPTIVIDPGHGGADDGAKGNGLKEKNLTLDVALRVNRLLMEKGFSTVLTRDSDVYVALSDRVAIADASPGCLFVSIHFNQSAYGYVNGVETYYADAKDTPLRGWPWSRFLNVIFPPKPVDKGQRLAACMQRAVAGELRVVSRGIKSRDLYVVHHTKEPAILVEPGFISNPAEAKLLMMSGYRERLAVAIVSGLQAYLRGDDPTIIQMVKK
ncbi:MAG: N-acetylmuramoyl-L-alanine amidase [Chthoniobacteraceae bacterium]